MTSREEAISHCNCEQSKINKFKSGDIIECIDPDPPFHVMGGIYTILGINNYKYVILDNNNDDYYAWSESRFKLAEQTEEDLLEGFCF